MLEASLAVAGVMEITSREELWESPPKTVLHATIIN
jgi:hypothetical protein